MIRACRQCGKREDVVPSKAKRPFCSPECYRESMRKPYRNTPTYQSWRSMIRRCTEPKNKKWHLYGGRGVTVCARWRASLQAFVEDMGPRTSLHHSIDRVDPHGNYEPGNCRWATAAEQRHNRRVELRGERHPNSKLTRRDVRWIRKAHAASVGTYQQLAQRFGVSKYAIEAVVSRRNWSHVP